MTSTTTQDDIKQSLARRGVFIGGELTNTGTITIDGEVISETPTQELSQCPSCLCMTKTIGDKYCGKCKAIKTAAAQDWEKEFDKMTETPYFDSSEEANDWLKKNNKKHLFENYCYPESECELSEEKVKDFITQLLATQANAIFEDIEKMFECKNECDGEECECEVGYDVASFYECRHCNEHDRVLDRILAQIKWKYTK
jgi:hypothetical protein